MFLHIFNVFVCVDNASTIDIRLAKTFDKSMYLVTLHVKYIDSRYIPIYIVHIWSTTTHCCEIKNIFRANNRDTLLKYYSQIFSKSLNYSFTSFGGFI